MLSNFQDAFYEMCGIVDTGVIDKLVCIQREKWSGIDHVLVERLLVLMRKALQEQFRTRLEIAVAS